MDIMICGASGMIGQALLEALHSSHRITVVGRDYLKLSRIFGDDYHKLTWDKLNPSLLNHYDVIINLAGESIGEKRWTKSQKQKIIQSRVKTTQRLVQYCCELGSDKAPRLINASAIGIYGLPDSIDKQNSIIFDEHSKLSSIPRDFLSLVGQRWEAALVPAMRADVRVVVLRLGVVLSRKGGALKKMLPAYRLGLGAILGSGKQPISWVALNDVIRAISFLLERPEENGIFNIVSDDIVQQESFSKILSKILHRPSFLFLPSAIVTLLFGQMGRELLLNGQKVKANRLQQLGFNFQFKKLNEGLQEALR